MNSKESEFFTTNEVSQRLGVSVGTVQNLVDKGILEAIITQGGHRRIRVESLKQYREKMGYKNSDQSKCIYVIHSGDLTDVKALGANKKMAVRIMTHPLELLELQDQIDCIFMDARCPWLDISSTACINKYAKKFQIFIYNADLLEKNHLNAFEENVLMLYCGINSAIVDAYIHGKMH
jgi:excisionase family DNA binding protein